MRRPAITGLALGVRWAAAWPALYAAAILWPIAAMMLGGPGNGTSFMTSFANAAGFVVFTGSVAQVLLVARHLPTRRTYARLLRVHRTVGWVLLPLALAHVIILFLDDPGRLALLDVRSAPPRALAGSAALVALVLIPATTIFRRRLRLSYEVWRALHLMLTALLIAGAYVHILLVSNYTASQSLRLGLALFVSAAALSIFLLRALRPFRALRRRRFRVSQVREEGARCSTLVLEPEQGEGPAFEPGQFVWIKDAVRPLGLREHPFSVASSGRRPDRIELTVRALGDFTTSVSCISVGSTLLVDGPYGGWRLPATRQACCLVAGGVGITPAMSLLRTLADDGDARPLLLLVASRTWEDVLFHRDLEALCGRLNLRVVYVLADGSRPTPPTAAACQADIRSGMIDGELLAEVAPCVAAEAAWFVCGPPPMMRKLDGDLRALGVNRRAIHLEDYRMA
ncbi:MAG TPA: ferric reductase-like transmembrane domain-containing protein [Gemmatimonadaceae bacterium]|nr:ferric reductase-like transmembrane domain-containing protein [Gemmatimonadaceae bacterium]